MSEIDILKRIETLENKVAELENTLNTIGMMEKSERITEYLQNRRRNQSLVSLVNSMSDEEIVFGSQEIENTKRLVDEQKKIELQIRASIENERQNINKSANDESLFNTERNGQEITITGYNGFNDHTIIIPSTINGISNSSKTPAKSTFASACGKSAIPAAPVAITAAKIPIAIFLRFNCILFPP